MDAYRIADEPMPGRLERFVADPVWPLLAMMFGGAWIGLPWFVFNGVALGSASVRREIAWAAGALAGATLLALAGGVLVVKQVVTPAAIPYLVLAPLVWKLGVAYRLLTVQRHSFALWEHFGGQPRRAFLIIIACLLLRGPVIRALGHPLLLVVLS
jgi:hypothetical protein